MRTTLISHSSVLVEAGDISIWCDPWLDGKVFADSWALLDQPADLAPVFERVTHIWVSHEHPDHFHLGTLRALPQEVKDRVTLLFQDDGSQKMPDAFTKLGFPTIQLLPHRQTVAIGSSETGDVDVYCYQQGLMNSALAVRHDDVTTININDCELTNTDARLIKTDLGTIDVALNQFSLAGYNGSNDPAGWSRAFATRVIDDLLNDHERLGADVTIPFASFIYFCREDNKFLNQYGNRPVDVVEAAETRGVEIAVLANGDCYDTEADEPGVNTEAALKHWDDIFDGIDQLPIDELQPVALSAIAASVASRSRQLHEAYPKPIMKLLPPIVADIPDLGISATLDLCRGTLTETTDEPELRIHSEALDFAFKTPFGLQSVGVGARYINLCNDEKWRRYRMLLSLNNAGISLRPSKILNREFVGTMAPRARGAASQLVSQLDLIR